MTYLQFENVSLIEEEKAIIKNISLSVEENDFISVVGPSGGGKSTFLKLCAHLISPSSGSIFFNGKNLTEYNPVELRKDIVYCFQTPYLFGSTVMDNLVFPFSIRNKKPDLDRIYELLSLFNLDKEFIHNQVKNLSGGEKQRISLIRSIIFKPQILLLDETTSALDAENSAIVESVINGLNQQGVTIIWVTHNLEQSRKYANKVLTLESGEIKSLEVVA